MNMKAGNVTAVVAKFILIILVSFNINVQGEAKMEIAKSTNRDSQESLVEPTQLGLKDTVYLVGDKLRIKVECFFIGVCVRGVRFPPVPPIAFWVFVHYKTKPIAFRWNLLQDMLCPIRYN